MKENSYENCIICGESTGVRSDSPISDRQFYIESAGQLCEKCYNKMFRGKEDPTGLKPNVVGFHSASDPTKC